MDGLWGSIINPSPSHLEHLAPLVHPMLVLGISTVLDFPFFSVTWISSLISLGNHFSQQKKCFLILQEF